MAIKHYDFVPQDDITAKEAAYIALFLSYVQNHCGDAEKFEHWDKIKRHLPFNKLIYDDAENERIKPVIIPERPVNY